MLLVSEGVHDVQIRRSCGEAGESILRERAHDRAGDPALEVARDVFDGLAGAQRDLGRWLDDLATEFANGDHERRSRAQRRLLEEQRDVLTREGLSARPSGAALPLQLGGQIEHAHDLRVVEVENRQEVLRPERHRACLLWRHPRNVR